MIEKKYIVYLIRCRDNSLYCGWTTDLKRRLRAHNGELSGGAKFTAGRRPCRLVFFREYPSRSQVLRAESRIKKLKKVEKEAMVSD